MKMNLDSAPIDPIFEKYSKEIFSVLAKAYGFDLTALTAADVQRLLGFVQLTEIGSYPEFSGWSEQVFLTARYVCEQTLNALIDQQSK